MTVIHFNFVNVQSSSMHECMSSFIELRTKCATYQDFSSYCGKTEIKTMIEGVLVS